MPAPVRRRHAEGGRERRERQRFAFLFITQAADTIAFVILAASNAKTEALIVAISCKAA
jgi:hypothetical protein